MVSFPWVCFHLSSSLFRDTSVAVFELRFFIFALLFSCGCDHSLCLSILYLERIFLIAFFKMRRFFLKSVWVCVSVCVCVCVCCVCVCVCVCVFITYCCKDFPWLNKTINVMSEFRSAMVCWENNSVWSTFVASSLKIIAGHSSWTMCKKVSIKPGKATRSKRQLL